jgi:hypothetical protein
MWRLHVLAEFLYWYGLLEIGLEMIHGTYDPDEDRREVSDFPTPFDGSAGQVDG